MSTIPSTRVGVLEFFETHVPLWVADPTLIGLTLEAVTDLQVFTTNARTNWENAKTARVASKGATEGFYNAIDTLRESGGAAIAEIRAFARSTQNPEVYIMAGIPAPASPSPVPAPDAPTNLTITMQTTGEAVLKWKAPQPRPGAEIFTVVQRRLNGTGPFVEFASTGEKTIIDATIPPGTQSVSYVLRSRRGDQMSGPGAPVTQFLGIPGNQAQGASEDEGGLTLAA